MLIEGKGSREKVFSTLILPQFVNFYEREEGINQVSIKDYFFYCFLYVCSRNKNL